MLYAKNMNDVSQISRFLDFVSSLDSVNAISATLTTFQILMNLADLILNMLIAHFVENADMNMLFVALILTIVFLTQK